MSFRFRQGAKWLISSVGIIAGLFLILPSLLLIVLAVLGMSTMTKFSVMSESGSHFSLKTLGAIMVNGEIIIPGWMSQFGAIVLAVIGIYIWRVIFQTNTKHLAT